MSKLRRRYFFRLFGRIFILILAIFTYFYAPETLDVVKSGFFRGFSPLHILWIVWTVDMIDQLFPISKHIPLGSHKHFLGRFKPKKGKINYIALREYVIFTTKSAYKVFILWTALTLALGVLYMKGLLDHRVLFLISVFFYVCDLICVLIWCPFRLMMKTRCCTTCRIFNWDHLMMFTPMLFVGSFYSNSLLLMAFAVWVVWEICFMMYPERFWDRSNMALTCASCTDKLCTQYCRKLRH